MQEIAYEESYSRAPVMMSRDPEMSRSCLRYIYLDANISKTVRYCGSDPKNQNRK